MFCKPDTIVCFWANPLHPSHCERHLWMVPCAAGHAGPREADAAPAVLRVGVGLHGEAGAQVPGLRLAAVELLK